MSFEQFGHDRLGPVLNMYMLRLHAWLHQARSRNDRVLFALRAGLRIEELYRCWLVSRRATPPGNIVRFRTSRLMAMKAAYRAAPELAVTWLGSELQGHSLDDIVRCILHSEVEAGRMEPVEPVPQAPLHEFLAGQSEVAEAVRRHLDRQSELYGDYLACVAAGADRLILVDSGWQGTTQLLLEAAFSQYDWKGVYFGCMGRCEILGRQPGPMHGLMFDSSHYDAAVPETAFVVHRHLVESLLEPAVRSVEDAGRAGNEEEQSSPPGGVQERPQWDLVFDGVCAYLAAHGGDGLTSIEANYRPAMADLARMLCFPTAEEVPLACGKPRSQDLGRQGAALPVMPPKPRFPGDNADHRIHQAIWRPGQAALEFPPGQAKARQRALLAGVGSAATEYFVARGAGRAGAGTGGHVAIITRTKDRPILLRRAAASVAAQTYTNFTWVVVNDGGCLDDVLEVIEESQVNPLNIIVCANRCSLGMEAASNTGIAASSSDYVVIHDDDDSWHPDFLAQTVAFLAAGGAVYGGVVAGTVYVSEEIRNGAVVEHERWPYNAWLQTIHLAEMAVGNVFAPIAFLYRRDFWERLGGYDETLPVLGDWDFNLRFLTLGDIGVLPQPLAHYHHRDRGAKAGTYANSVIGGISRHARYNAIVRNKYLRNGDRAGPSAVLSALMGGGYAQQDLRHRLEQARLNGKKPANGSGRNDGDADGIEDPAALLVRQQVEMDRRWSLIQFLARDAHAQRGGNSRWEEWTERSLAEIEDSIAEFPLGPPPDFDEQQYLAWNPDVRQGISLGTFASGFDHYVKHGAREGRRRPLRRTG